MGTVPEELQRKARLTGAGALRTEEMVLNVGPQHPATHGVLRVIVAELNRITNHLMFTGSFGLELGATTPVMYAFRERELLQSAMEMVTGGRMHFGFIRPGGLKEDVPKGFPELVLKGIRQLID